MSKNNKIKVQKKYSRKKGNYYLEETIGEGAFAKVKLGIHIPTGEKVAIKILNKDRLFEDPSEDINKIRKEINILKRIRHKNVIQLYEIIESKSNLYIVMEYCENGDLCTYMCERQKNKKISYFFNENFIWKIFIQISIGLYYIHSKKILHRDIKTLNIFLTKELDGKIGDLGVAKVLEGTSHAITFIGTPYYVSPEMCQNKPYNEKSDIWALGCILYELIAFRHPFTASNQAALFIKILHGNYTPLPESTSKDLSNMVKFILQKNYIKCLQ